MSGRNIKSSSRREDHFEDMEHELHDMDLVVEGKKVKATSGVLAYNSSVFKTLITNARISQQLNFEDFDLTDVSWKRLKLEIPNTKYKDMKMMITCLQSIGDKRELTGEDALRVLPLAEQYQIKQLTKTCGKALHASMVKLQEEHGRGNIPIHDVMKILSAADTHHLDKVRSVCIDELSYKPEPTRRRHIVKEKHVSEKTKLKILEKVCNKLEDDYAANLKQIRYDLDKRCREIEQRRDEFMETLETWKTDLQQGVDEMLENNKKTHEKLIDELHQKKIIESLEQSMKQTNEELLIEQQHMNDRMQSLLETMETNKIIGDLEATKMREGLEEAQSKMVENIRSIATRFRSRTDATLRVCSSNGDQAGFASTYSMEESVWKSIEDIDEKLKQNEMTKVELEEEKLAHDKTKNELLKMKMKEHDINTWLKWAKPEASNEDKCMCFRHTKSKRNE